MRKEIWSMFVCFVYAVYDLHWTIGVLQVKKKNIYNEMLFLIIKAEHQKEGEKESVREKRQ